MAWINVDKLMNYGYTFNIFVGTRGGGKTYGSLDYFIRRYLEYGEKMMFMRRTSKELDALLSAKGDVDLNPFKRLDKDKGYGIDVERINKDMYGAFIKEEFFCYIISLVSISTVRGFDSYDIKNLFYDEFIQQENVRAMKDESGAFFNAYETINRNRELEGNPPVRCILAANSNNLAHPILMDTGISDRIMRMKEKGQQLQLFKEKDTLVYLSEDAEYIEEKSKTALYRFSKGTKFQEMSLRNSFVYNDMSNIHSLDIKPFVCFAQYGEDLYIYQHKSEGYYYVSRNKGNAPYRYSDSKEGKKKFIANIGRYLYDSFIRNQIVFETFSLKSRLTELFL